MGIKFRYVPQSYNFGASVQLIWVKSCWFMVEINFGTAKLSQFRAETVKYWGNSDPKSQGDKSRAVETR
jgi:hypothetical protein